MNLVHPPNLPQNHTQADEFVAKCPTPGELFDAIRPWGSLRTVGVWVQNIHQSQDGMTGGAGCGGGAELKWSAKVDFWYEDEARRFEVGWGQTGSLLKGWQL